MDTVIFDLMGVLFEGGHWVSEHLYPEVKDRLTLAEVRRHYIQYAVGKITREEFWSRLFGDWQAQGNRLLEPLQPRKDLDAIRPLKGRYFLALATEIPRDWAPMLLDRARLHDFFDVAVISGLEGVTKPHREIYERLVARLPKTGRRIYVDDKIQNLATANTFGITTVWMKNPGKKPDADYPPDYVVTSLYEAVAVIQRELRPVSREASG